MCTDEVQGITVPAVNSPEGGIADTRGFFQHGVKYGLQIAWKAADDLSTSEVAVCCSNDSVRSVVRWRNSFSNRAFSMAMTAWAAKVSTNLICFSVNGRTSARCRTKMPIGVPSRRRGTPRIVRKPPPFANLR